jgi:hypothetical protein
VTLAQQACKLLQAEHQEITEELDTLAAAFAEVGDFGRAVRAQQRAIASVDEKDRADFESRLKLYQARQPYRDSPKSQLLNANVAAN